MNIRVEKACGTDIGKDAPAMWTAQKKYEEKHLGSGVRADEEMDVGV